METTQWEDIVLDTSAFIQGEIEPLRRLTKRLWTLPQVLQEIKDRKAKQSASFALDIIPDGIKQAQPSKESISFIIDYATKSGDIQALSRTDILVLALTHEIRQRNEGTKQKSTETLLGGIKDVEEGQDLTAKEEEEAEQQEKEEALKEKGGEAFTATSTSKPTSTTSSSAVVQPGKSWASVLRPSSVSSSLSSPSALKLQNVAESIQQNGEKEEDEEEETVEQLTSSLKDANIGDNEKQVKTKSVMWDDDDFAVESSTNSSKTKKREAPVLDSKQDWPDLPQPKPKPASAVASAWAKPPSLTSSNNNKPSSSSSNDAMPTATTMANESSANKDQQQQVKRHDPKTSRILSAGGVSTTTASSSKSKLDEDDVDLEWAKPGSTSSGWTHVSNNKKKSNFNKPPQQQQALAPPQQASDNVPMVPECSVACSTADFACQNILLQLKLGIVTLDGRRVTRVKSWVYKCDTCLRIFPIKEKRLFCSACGHPSLSRLAYSIDPNGNRRYHYSKSRRMRTQGNVYPIGKKADLLLREDQLLSGIWAQRMQRKSNAASMFGEDVNDAMGIDLRANSNTIRVGFGSQNPNAMRGRERRGSKKKKQDK